jgi:hypothetical protein
MRRSKARVLIGGVVSQPVRAGAPQGGADGDRAAVEVEVFPQVFSAEAEEFAFAESGVEGEFGQGVQPVSARGCEEMAGFVGGEASGPGCACGRCGRRSAGSPPRGRRAPGRI